MDNYIHTCTYIEIQEQEIRKATLSGESSDDTF